MQCKKELPLHTKILKVQLMGDNPGELIVDVDHNDQDKEIMSQEYMERIFPNVWNSSHYMTVDFFGDAHNGSKYLEEILQLAARGILFCI